MMQASSAQNVPQQLPSGFNAGGMQSGTTQQQITTLLQRAQASSNNPLQHAIQAQDPSHARQFGMPLPQGQQQQNGSGLARIGQNLNPGMGLPQGPGSLQQNFIQPSPSVPHVTAQSSSAPLASQPAPPGAQQVSGPSNLASMTLRQLFSPPVPPTTPPASAAMSRTPHLPPLLPARRKKPSRSQGTPMPPPIPTAAATSGFTSPSSQTPKSPKGKPKRKPPTRRNGSKRENGVEAPTAAHSVAPTPSSSKPADAKGGGKRVRSDDDDTASDAPRLGVSSAPSPKRVKPNRGTTK